MDKLVDTGRVLDAEHFLCDLIYVLRRYFKAGLLVLQKRLYVFDLGQLKKRIQLSLGIEEDVEGPDLFSAGGRKIAGVTFEYMGEVDPEPVYLAASKGIHIILRDEGAFALLDPGKLDLFVPVEVRIEMGQDVFLDDDGFIARHRDRELEDFHRCMKLRDLRILPVGYQYSVKTG